MSYLGSADAVATFIPPTAVEKWWAVANSLGAEMSMDWPSFDEGNLPAAKRLARHSKDKSVMLFVAAVIGAFADKSKMLFDVYTAAGELKSPIPATSEQKAFHTDPIRSRSFYYFNEDAAPLNELPGYKEDESDSKVDCAKTVSAFISSTRSHLGQPAVFTSLGTPSFLAAPGTCDGARVFRIHVRPLRHL